MFENIGTKIKSLSKVTGILNLIIFGLGAIVLGSEMDSFLVFLIGAFFGVQGYILSWYGYAFGQLVEEIHEIKQEKKERLIETGIPEL